jgi:hypothetical protein
MDRSIQGVIAMQVFTKCHNIKIDGDEYTSGFLGLDWFPSAASAGQKHKYESDTLATLDRLTKTWTGWAVITEIYYTGKTMVIQPYYPTPQTGTFNAYAMPKDWAAATLKDTTVLDQFGKPPPAGQPRTIGTGTGSDVIVRFSATTFSAPGAPAGPGTSPDEILLHEMIHGLRQMKGRMVREPITVNLNMHNYEEFAAITISNVYRSELNLSPLRSDHTGFAPLTGPTTNLATFKSTYHEWLIDLDIEQPTLCKSLTNVRCSFNPFI